MPKVWKAGDPDIPADAVLVDRTTKWGNPFRAGRDGGRAEVIARYEKYLGWHPELTGSLHELVGRDLVCHCAPKACHADVLLRLASEEDF